MATASIPPGPAGHFFLGNLPELSRDPLGFLMKCAREYGDLVSVRFGTLRGYLLNHSDYIEYVLVTNNRNFIKERSSRWRTFRRLLGNGLLTSEGDFWLRQRRLAQPAFHRDRIDAYGRTMVDYTERMLDGWQSGETRDVHRDMMRLTLNIVTKTLFDVDEVGEAEEVGAALEVATNQFASEGSLLRLLDNFLPTPGRLRFERAAKKLDEILYGIIFRRRKSGRDRGDLLSMLLNAQDEDGSRMTDTQLRDEAMTLFLAGHETTALALSWTWYLLAQNPAAESRLLEELQSVLNGRAPKVEDLPQLRYAECVIKEAMRLYPPAWSLGREALQDCEIGGYRVRAGEQLYIAQWAMHRDPRYFESPEEFNPDRWGDGLEKRLPRYAYCPFGGGPRLCIGNSFAMMEAVLVMATIAQKYRLALVPDQRILPLASVTLRPKNGIKVVLEAR